MSENLDNIGQERTKIIASDDRTTAYLFGRIDMDSSPAVRDHLLSTLRPPYPTVVSVDLSAVTQMDSSGVATLIEALKTARAKRIELRLQGLGEGLLRLFESTRILALFDGSQPKANQSEREAD